MPKYRSRATLQEGRRLDINELRRSGVRSGEFGVTFARDDDAPGTLNVYMEEGGRSWLRVRLPPNVDQTFTLVPVKRPFWWLPMVLHLLADGLSRLGAVEAARGEPVCLPEVLGSQGCLRVAVPDTH